MAQSVYTACSGAARQLAEGSEIFTEIDVVERAAPTKGRKWTSQQTQKAFTEANQVCATLYREGKLVRYGPVERNGITDYARRNSRIVYAGGSGPEQWVTPNGSFERILVEGDPVSSGAGRRAGTARDDSTPWEAEADLSLEELQHEVSRLTTELETARTSSNNGHMGLPASITISDEVVAVMVERIMPQLKPELLALIDEEKIIDQASEKVKESLAETLIGKS